MPRGRNGEPEAPLTNGGYYDEIHPSKSLARHRLDERDWVALADRLLTLHPEDLETLLLAVRLQRRFEEEDRRCLPDAPEAT